MHKRKSAIKIIVLLFICIPFAVQSQQRADDSLRRIADTMHFSKPFVFSSVGKSDLPPEKIYQRTEQWLQTIKDSLPAIDVSKDSIRKKITATHIPASANISCTIAIIIKDNAYKIILASYIFHSINGKAIPVEKAAQMPAYKKSVNIERVLITHNYQTIFNSLKDYIQSGKHQ